MLSKEQELKIFRAVCSKNKIVKNDHQNVSHEHSERAGLYNQEVNKVKLKEFVEQEGFDFEYWKNL